MSALSAAAVAAIEDLQLAARVVVEGLRAGGHRSPYHGYSAEFQQHRPYRSGDDLKYLDWKLLARTDRLYSRQFRETTSMSVMIVLDASASLAFPDDDIAKFRYASILAASIAYLVITQGDAAGLMTMSDGALRYLPARSGRAQLQSLVARIDTLSARGTWRAPEVITRAAELLKRRGVVIVISDFYDDEDATRTALRRVARRGHDVAMLHVVSPQEQTLPYRGELEFADLETGERRLVDARALSAAYRATFAEFLARSRTAAHRDGIDYTLLSTADPPSHALRAWLLRRGAAHDVGNTGVRVPR
ncbi:MAG TPA: DUF58 domain-containing protein [Longimicrobiales bacterium]|nr:DUF58 domain-containing protein [Longimicrobiales bacterium]